MRREREYYCYIMLPKTLREELEAMTFEAPKNAVFLSKKKHESLIGLIKLLRDPLALF